MRWLCPFTELQPLTRDALLEHAREGDEVTFVNVSHSARAYPIAVQELWEQARDFAVVEHDIVIRDDVAAAFHDCPEPYCAFPYEWTTNIGPALGCTRFRGLFTYEHRQAIYQASGHSWRQFDYALMRDALRGCAPHLHLPRVHHLNDAQKLVDPFAGWSLATHLAAMGYQIDDPDRLTATYVDGAVFG